MTHQLNASEAVADLVTQAIPDDDRLWVPQAPQVWFRPLLLNATNGEWVNLLRVRCAGVLSRHRHPAPVHGYVIKGAWRYLEHNWVATQGTYVFEPPGEVHTLVVDDDVDEMITLFHVCGAWSIMMNTTRPSVTTTSTPKSKCVNTILKPVASAQTMCGSSSAESPFDRSRDRSHGILAMVGDVAQAARL